MIINSKGSSIAVSTRACPELDRANADFRIRMAFPASFSIGTPTATSQNSQRSPNPFVVNLLRNSGKAAWEALFFVAGQNSIFSQNGNMGF